MKTGIELIAAERQRQTEVEGWTPEHDSHHNNGDLAWAAVCYAAPGRVFKKGGDYFFFDPWPWDGHWDKRPYDGDRDFEDCDFKLENGEWDVAPEVRIRMLEKAGALIAAEIDRLQRKEKG